MSHSIRRLCVFCGSCVGNKPQYHAAAESFGRMLAAEGIELVYGGGSIGLMGVVADAVLAAGGQVIGVIPHSLNTKELGHTGLTQQHIVNTMHERKALMADLSDAFVALPGGLGTFEEILEIVTWSQLGIHRKPCGILNVAGYYDRLIAFLDSSVEQGFVQPLYRGMILVETEPAAMLSRMRAYEPPQLARWADPGQR
jgi:uncharacterized protein (TIGR00730 family)